MAISNTSYKMIAGLLSVCLICLLVVGCGKKGEPPDKKQEAAGKVAAGKIPVAEPQPAAVVMTESGGNIPVPGDTAAAAPVEDAVAPAEGQAPPQTPETASPSVQEQITAAPAGTQSETVITVTVAPASPEVKQAEIEAVTKEAVTLDSAAVTEAAGEKVAPAETPPVSTADLAEPTPDTGEAPVIDLDLKAELEEDAGEGEVAAGHDEGAFDIDEAETKSGEFFDPFMPLFQKDKAVSPASVMDSGTESGPQKKFLTPLERIDVGQLSLEGIIMAQSGNRAIVTDASGKGYVITPGTYIGLNSGKVEQIESDRVVILEIIGTRQMRNVLKLQKTAGE